VPRPRLLHAAIPAGSITTTAFGLALVSTLWAFDGWADLSYAAAR